MKVKVVVDTNSINNTGIGNKFFGSREKLKSIIEKIDLYVPEIVIKEIKEHKRKSFNDKRRELINNDIFRLIGGDGEKYLQLDAQTIIEDDLSSEDIPYKILESGDIGNFFRKFEDALIKNRPPFDTGSDKGIKDAFIADSVDLFLETLGAKEKIILVSKDGRLKEYFENNSRVRVVGDIAGVQDLIEHEDGLVTKTSNTLEIGFSGVREKSELERKIDKMLTNLRNSVNFNKTHEFIEILKKNESLLTEEDKADIIRSALNNNQIRWIIKDQDIYTFLVAIYYECSDLLTEQEQIEFEVLMEISHNFTFSG